MVRREGFDHRRRYQGSSWCRWLVLSSYAHRSHTDSLADRRFVYWDPDHPLDPAAFLHAAQPGDFELESLQLEDVLVTVYQPGHFRPYTASIFRADMRTFRKQWMFYDFLSAENVVGQFDNCLFSLHKPQSIGRTTEQDLKDGQWSRMVRHPVVYRHAQLTGICRRAFVSMVSILIIYRL